MPSDRYVCVICGSTNEPLELAQIPSNVREFRAHVYPVWRCATCHGLHSAQPVDYAALYQNYPILRAKYDYGSQRHAASKLKILRRHGFKKSHSLLDYGAGKGFLTRYLNENGFADCESYDPFASTPWPSRATFDWVISQDVIEHVDDFDFFFDTQLRFLHKDGRLMISTPNAEGLRLDDDLDQVLHLHQPHHRHIFSPAGLEQMARRFCLEKVGEDFCFYQDTLYPGVSTQFLARYCAAIDCTLDAIFDPISIRPFLKTPSLFFWLFCGGFFCRSRQHFLQIFRRHGEA